ncbi:hypothetical protein [Salinibaculum salinum]|uniref:hypothetical protein n=1 Tax=Salinibaculum salinum TaxID=3131996 RepID=UPI0030ED1E20
MGYPFVSPSGYEERLNQQFAGFLYYSLEEGPELLNRIHGEPEFSFSDEARVVAHQNAPLPYNTDTGPDREIDWVVGDDETLVGYESKYGDSLKSDQLRGELEKLRANADGRDVRLVTITPHTTPPGLLDQFEDEPLTWMGWNTVARRISQIEPSEVAPAHRPILKMLQDLFEAEDMHPFTGFDHHDKLQYRYFIRDLRQELVDTEVENPGKIHTSTTKDAEPSQWKRLVPKRLDVPFVVDSREDDWKRTRSYLTVVVDTETHSVHVGIVFNLREVEAHRRYVVERMDDLVEYATERDLELWASMNSFNQWKLGIATTSDPIEMRAWLANGGENTVQAGDTDYKKAIFVTECRASEPAALVEEAKEELLTLHQDFLVEDDLYEHPTLEG